MGKDEIEARGSQVFWPMAERDPGSASGHPLGAPRLESESRFGSLDAATSLRILWERRWLILAFLAIGVAGSIVATLLATPQYRATATIEINPPRVEVMESARAAPVTQNERSFLLTQYGLLRSRSLAARVTRELNLASNEAMVPTDIDRAARQELATNILQNHLDIDPVQESLLIRINYTSPDPALAARIVNGFAEAFIGSSLERRYEASSYARDFLQIQIANVRRELENSERELVAYARQQGIINTGTVSASGERNDSNSLTGESLVALNRVFTEAQARRIAAEQRYRESGRRVTTAEVSERTASLRAQIAVLEAEYRDKANIYHDAYPEMVRLRSRIASLQQAVENEATNVASARAATLRSEYEAALGEERSLARRVQQLRADALDLRGRSIRYNILQRDVDTNRTLYDALLQRYKEIGVAGGVGNSHASIVDRGEAPNAPYRPSLMLNLLIGLGLGFAGGIGLSLLLEFLSDTIKTPDDVREKLGLPFLGGVPPTERPVAALAETASQLSEAYLSIATTLGFATVLGVPRTLLVTSCRSGEGKSTSALALARALARLGNRVLLLDADMRNPAFTTGSKRENGLSVVLTHDKPLSSQTMMTEIDGLWLLPCGPIPPNPAELLATSRFREVLNEAASNHDVVIVDGPPVLGLADAPLLGAACQGTLLIVEFGKTRTRAAVESLHRLKAGGTRLMGAVLIRYKHQSASYGYTYEAYRYADVGSEKREIKLAFKRE